MKLRILRPALCFMMRSDRFEIQILTLDGPRVSYLKILLAHTGRAFVK